MTLPNTAGSTIDFILKGLQLRPGPSVLTPGVIYYEPNEMAQRWEPGHLAKFSLRAPDGKIHFEVRLYSSNLIIREDLALAKQKLPEGFALRSVQRERYNNEIWCSFEIPPGVSHQGYVDQIFSCKTIVEDVVYKNCHDLAGQLIQNKLIDLSKLLAIDHEDTTLYSNFMNRLSGLTNECLKNQQTCCDNHFVPELEFPDSEFIEAYMRFIDVDPLGRKKILEYMSRLNKFVLRHE